MGSPKSLTDVRQRFSDVIHWLAASAKSGANALRNTEQRKDTFPDKNGWSGDPFDVTTLSKLFERVEHDDDMIELVRASETPGVVGDLQLISLQGDYLATLERAYRLRMTTRCRAIAHVASRQRGHGHDGGLFIKGVLGYVSRLAKLSKDTATS